MHCLGTFEESDDSPHEAIHYLQDYGTYRNVWHDPLWFRQNFVGIVFQSFHLLPTLNVSGNVKLPLRLGHYQRYTTRDSERGALVRGALDKTRRRGQGWPAEPPLAQVRQLSAKTG